MESTNNHSTHTSNKQHNSSEGICVGIRCRPLNERELNNGQDKIFKCFKEKNAISQVKENQPVEGQTYFYDKVFDESSTTVEVYTHIGKDIVNGVMNGINGTIFAYGQTSSGKTHTMLGGGDQIGVLNMAAQDIFNHIEKHSNRDFLLRASFVEIYNENIRDLFSDSSDASVAIREDPRRGVYCEAIEIMISSYESICKALKTGIAKRAVEATAMNDTSSRSHTIFKLVIESKESSRNGYEGDGAVLVGTLNLVDLAGSESVKHTGAIGQRAKEGGKINQSLLSLSRVIHALSQPGVHVSFRDSKLTRLLQPSLSGNAKMSIVCCITPASHYLEETRSTLQFASRAKLVETHATVNEVLDESAQIRRLKKEFDDLKASLSAKVKSLEEDNAQKDLRIIELTASGESKENSLLNDSSRKRPRPQQVDKEEEQPSPPKSLASIKDVLLQLHNRRAQGLVTMPKTTTIAVMDIDHNNTTTTSTSINVTNTHNTTNKVVDDPLKLTNVNPMTFGLRNLLMKDLENKLKTRNNKTNDNESNLNKDADNINVVVVDSSSLNKVQDDLILKLNNELNEIKDILANKDISLQDLIKERDDLLNQLELEMGANAEYVQEQKDLYSIQELKLQEQQSNNQTLMNQLLLVEVSSKKYEEELAIVLEKYEALRNDSSYQLLENENIIQNLKEKIESLTSTLATTTSTVVEVVKEDEDLIRANQEQAIAIETLEAKVYELIQLNNQLTMTVEDMNCSVQNAQKLLLESQMMREELTNQQSIESSAMLTALKDENLQLQTSNSDLILQLSTANEMNHDIQGMMKSELNHMKEQMIELQSQNIQSSDMIVTLEEEIQKFTTIIDQLQSDLQLSSESIAQHEANNMTNQSLSLEKMQSLQTTIDELQQTLVVKSSEAMSEYESICMKVNDLTVSLETSSNLVLMLEDKNLMFATTITELNQQIQQLNNEIVDHKANITISNEFIVDLEATLEQSKHDHEESENNVRLLKDNINELHMKHSEFVNQLKLQADENESQLHVQIHSLEVESNELKVSLQQSQEQNQQLAIKLDELLNNNLSNNSSVAIGGTISRLNEVELSQEALDLARKDMEKQLASMTSDLGNKDGTITKLMNTITELNERITIADQRLNTYDNSYHENDDVLIKKRVNQLQTNVDLLTNEKENLLLKLQTMERDLKSNGNDSIRQVEHLEKLCNEQSQMISKLTTDSSMSILEFKREINDVSIQRDNCEKRLESATKKIDSLTYDIEQLQKVTINLNNNKDSSMDNVTQNVEELIKEKQQLHEDLLELSNRLKKSQEESKKMRDLWEDSENLRQCSDDESKLLKAELHQALVNIEQLTIALEEATNEADKLPTIMEEDNSIDHDTFIALEAEVELLKQSKYDLAQELLSYVEMIESKDEKINQYMNDISTLENDIMKLKEQACELQAMIDMESHTKVELDQVCNELKEKDQINSTLISNLEIKVSELEEDCFQINQKLQEHMHISEDSMTELKTNAEAEISSLYQLINDKDQLVSDLSNQIEVLIEMKVNLSTQISELTINQQSKDSMIHELQQELDINLLTKHNFTSTSNDLIVQHEEMISQLQIEKEYISKELSTVRHELQAANEHCATNEDLLTTIKEQIDVKDKRIEHLEACKLTKEQMEKIKVIKEERKKYQEDSKTLKKQLQQLTIKFDELRSSKLNNSSNNGVGGGPTTDYIISDLKVQLVTTSQQLSQSQEEVKLIKSKLKECAVQLKEYENDHMKIVTVLERYEIDTRGLLPLEHSVDDDVSIQHGDISDAVTQLGEKLDTMKALVARKEIAKTQKVVDLENMISNYTIELEDLKTQKLALEKRLEQLKNSAKNAREQNASMTIQIEELNDKVKELKESLMTAEKRVVNSSDVVSSEIQALEEENIDLLKENKELRIEVSRYRSTVGSSMNTAASTTTSNLSNNMLSSNTIFEDPKQQVSDIVSSPLIQSSSNLITISGNKRTFGTDLSNTVTTKEDDKHSLLSMSSKKQSITDSITKMNKNLVVPTASMVDDVTIDHKARRMKAKALVDENASQSQENAGECNQS